ncbi:MAG TPA: NAD-dependent epimerase/dehydratase family protein [Candidatus Bathyarchaeia archaeon]|nr:NAD-dependent epimerase/dehydratase family protein [Candidatus Bathyarchaeia archaeon]
MRVLVTGGCGLLGSHTCEYFANKGDEVVAFDNLTEYELLRTGYDRNSARRHIVDLLNKVGATIIRGDIRNYEELSAAAKGSDYVVHTAAQPAMTISIENPDLDFSTNVVGTLNVLKVAKSLSIPVVSCSSIHVYGNKINNTLKETEKRYVSDPPEIDEQRPVMQGTVTPLHASKRSGELYCQAFIDSYGLRAAVFRLTGMYGPRQFGGEDHGWVANFTIRTILNKPITVFGTGKQVRDIVYVSDVAEAFYAFYKRGKPGIYNIGGGKKFSVSLLECLDLIQKTTKRKPKVTFGPERLGDLRYFACDISKATELLGWTPRISPVEGIEKLAAWVETNKTLFAN